MLCRLLRKRSRAYQKCQLRCAGQLFSGLRFPSMFRREYVNAYSCTSFCQERSGEISCEPCAENTQRYIGVLSGADRRACQCKDGAIFCHQSALACMRLCLRESVSTGPPTQGTTTRDSRPARFVALAIDRCRALPAMRIRLASGFAGVCEMYEGARACAGCVAVGRAHASCLVWSRPCVREQVQSAFHVLAG